MRIFVPYLGPSTNSIYAGIHWAKRKKHKAQAMEAVRIATQGVEPIRVRVDLTFQPTLGKGVRRRDTSNNSYSAKMIEDALVECGVLQDDTGEFVRHVTLMEPVVDRKSETGTWVYIQEAK